MRIIAQTIAFIWASWWTFFGLASGIYEGLDPIGVFIHTAMPGLVFLASAVIAWRWMRTGRIILIVEGLAILILYSLMAHRSFSFTTFLFTLLTLSVPPLLAGCLLLFCRTTSPNK